MSANELMAAEAADAEALLDNLTLEELERLEWEMNEVARAPAHMQSTYSVDKAPTGPYSRNKLMLVCHVFGFWLLSVLIDGLLDGWIAGRKDV